MKHALFLSSILAGSFALCACGGDDTLFVQSDGGATDSASTTGVTIDNTLIDFGHADCGGTAPAARSIHVLNGTANAIHWNATISGSPIFSIAPPANASLPPGTSIDISVAAAALPTSTQFAKAETATVTVYTNDPNHFQTTIPLLVTASGASLSLSKSSLDFGDVPLGTTSAALTETLTNVGDEPVTLTAPTTAKSFSLAWSSSPADLSLATAANTKLTSTFLATSTTSTTASFPLAVKTGHLCGSAPTVTVDGEGTTGALSFQPGMLDFGNVRCGMTSSMTEADRTITITNNGNQTLTWQAGLRRGANSFYDIATTGTTLAPGVSGTIVVTPHAIPQTSSTASDFYADGIYITTDVPLDVPHLIELHETAFGAILTATPDDRFVFEHGSIGRQQVDPIRLENVGNAPLVFLAPEVGPAPFSVPTNTGYTSLLAGESEVFSLLYLPTDAASAGGELTFETSSDNFLCAPLPTLPLQGFVDNPDIWVSSAMARLDDVACGDPPTTQFVAVTNTTATSLDVRMTGTQYSAAPSDLLLNAGESGLFSVRQDYANRLKDPPEDMTISWTGSTSGSQTLPVFVLRRGADVSFTPVFALDFGAQQIGGDSVIPMLVTNIGTSAASIDVRKVTSPFSLEALTTAVLPGDSVLVSLHYRPTTLESTSASVDIEPAPNSCGTASGINVSGTGIHNGVAVAPTYVDLGRDPCGASLQPVVIANHGGVAFNWSASIDGSFVDGGNLAPNSSATITVSNAVAPASAHFNSLEITTDLPGDLPHEVGVLNNKQPTAVGPPVVCP